MLPSNETYEFEGQTFVDPNVSLNEQLGFIDNLRSTQQANNAQIRQDTYNLGTAVPSNLGGLVGGEGYFTSRIQTPQTNALAADLRASAQASALNDILKNEQAKMKKRYNNAYKAARRRAASYGGGGGNGGSPLEDLDDLIETESTTSTIGSIEPNFSPAASGTFSFTPNGSPFSTGGSGLNVSALPSQIQNVSKSLFPAGNIDVQRNASGAIINLRYNGKNYQGDAGQEMWNRLVDNGNISPVGN